MDGPEGSLKGRTANRFKRTWLHLVFHSVLPWLRGVAASARAEFVDANVDPPAATCEAVLELQAVEVPVEFVAVLSSLRRDGRGDQVERVACRRDRSLVLRVDVHVGERGLRKIAKLCGRAV
jgi:hypothetical protein